MADRHVNRALRQLARDGLLRKAIAGAPSPA